MKPPGLSRFLGEALCIIGALFAACSACGCTDESGARRALEGAGYKDIRMTGHRFHACGQSDDTCTGFEATGPTGKRVSGAVGCGLMFKGCTIRTD